MENNKTASNTHFDLGQSVYVINKANGRVHYGRIGEILDNDKYLVLCIPKNIEETKDYIFTSIEDMQANLEMVDNPTDANNISIEKGEDVSAFDTRLDDFTMYEFVGVHVLPNGKKLYFIIDRYGKMDVKRNACFKCAFV